MKDFANAAYQRLLYTISLPERGLRALAAIIGGTTSLLTGVLLPEALRHSTTYHVTFGLLQQFVIEQLAGIRPEADQTGSGQSFLARKVVGNVIEGAGLLSVGYSPLWVFAIVGDTAKGSNIYLKRLVTQLQRDGLVSADFQVHTLSDVLAALQFAATTSALTIDQPPLSRRELAEQAGILQKSYADVARRSSDLLPRIDAIWISMERLALKEGTTVSKISGMMALNAAGLIRKGGGSVKAAGQTGLALFDEAIIESYRHTLVDVSTVGVGKYLQTHYQPFWQQIGIHLDPGELSWTEKLLKRKVQLRQ